MAHFYEIGITIEFGIPKKKLEGKSDKVVLNSYRKGIEELLDNLIELRGLRVVTTTTTGTPFNEVPILTSGNFCFIPNFSFAHDNQVEGSEEYKVMRFFGATCVVRSEEPITEPKELLTGNGIVKDIKSKQKVNIEVTSLLEVGHKTLGYSL